MQELEDLFKGIVAVIDDDVASPESPINMLASQMEQANCHVIKLAEHPSDERLNSLSEVVFFVLDWNLHDAKSISEDLADPANHVRFGSALSRAHINENIEFIKKIRSRLSTPIFIFTHENIDEVKGILTDKGLYSDGPKDNIFVQSKEAVIREGVFKILTEWLQKHPSAYVLRKWESSYAKTRKDFFVDFYEHSRLWPVVLWKAYSDDGVSEAAELTNVIGRNILARLAPVQFAPEILASEDHSKAVRDEVKPAEIRAVLGGERFITKERLQDQISVGDLFKKSGKYVINVRPECDCVARDGVGQDEVQLYLIRGDKISEDKLVDGFSRQHGNFTETDATSVVFSMYEGHTIRFQMKDLRIEPWRDWKNHRVGRLIPPYSTKVQQRFGAYMQRVGLGRVPEHAISTEWSPAGEAQIVSAVATPEASAKVQTTMDTHVSQDAGVDVALNSAEKKTLNV